MCVDDSSLPAHDRLATVASDSTDGDNPQHGVSVLGGDPVSTGLYEDATDRPILLV